MRIKLTDKITTYAPQGLRAMFPNGCQWLGTVVVDDGRRGALMLSLSGQYIMVQSYKRTTVLVAERVAEALAEAMTREAPKPRQPGGPVGRPPEHGERMLQRMVSLTPAMVTEAQRIGQGNISAGVRAMVADHMERSRVQN